MRLASRICAQCRIDFAESYSVRILFVLLHIRVCTYGSADTQHFVSREKFTHQLLQRATINGTKRGRMRYTFFFHRECFPNRIDDFSQNWIKSIFDDTCIKCDIIEQIYKQLFYLLFYKKSEIKLNFILN